MYVYKNIFIFIQQQKSTAIYHATIKKCGGKGIEIKTSVDLKPREREFVCLVTEKLF